VLIQCWDITSVLCIAWMVYRPPVRECLCFCQLFSLFWLFFYLKSASAAESIGAVGRNHKMQIPLLLRPFGSPPITSFNFRPAHPLVDQTLFPAFKISIDVLDISCFNDFHEPHTIIEEICDLTEEIPLEQEESIPGLNISERSARSNEHLSVKQNKW
jgi:hypothetical protein